MVSSSVCHGLVVEVDEIDRRDAAPSERMWSSSVVTASFEVKYAA